MYYGCGTKELHQRVPFFVGSKKMVERAEAFMAKYPQEIDH